MTKLDEKQNARMHGLIAQVNGAAALLDPAIAKALGVTDEQMKKLKATNDVNIAARREALTGLQDMTPEQRAEAMTKLADKESKLLFADAGDELKKKLEDLKGTALTIDQAPLRPARPGN
jgi:antitoxin component of MazEF toxin-antitoxin module